MVALKLRTCRARCVHREFIFQCSLLLVRTNNTWESRGNTAIAVSRPQCEKRDRDFYRRDHLSTRRVDTQFAPAGFAAALPAAKIQRNTHAGFAEFVGESGVNH